MKKLMCLMLVICLISLTACNRINPDKKRSTVEVPQQNSGSAPTEVKQTESNQLPEINSPEDKIVVDEIVVDEIEEEIVSTVGDFVIIETKSKVKIKRYIGKASEVKIPETINKKPVMEIGDEAFDDKLMVLLIEIPPSVNKIGRYAFSDTSWFDKVLTDEFVIVGDGVLIKYNGTADKIIVPDTVKSIGYNEVFLSSGMSEIVIPNSVIYLNEGAFSHCENLKSIVIPNSVIYLGDYLFYQSSVTEITVPASVKNFGSGVFKTKSPVTIFGKKGSAIDIYINGNTYFTFVEQ